MVTLSLQALPPELLLVVGYTRSVSALLDAGFDIEHRGRGKSTPLLDAVQDGKIETAEYLLNAGANIHVKDHLGQNAIDMAVWIDNPHEMVELLLCRGTQINTQSVSGCTPVLLWAARRGLMSSVKMLCEAEAPVNLRDLDGQTALHHAARVGWAEAIRVLLQAGADPSAMDEEHQFTKRPGGLIQQASNFYSFRMQSAILRTTADMSRCTSPCSMGALRHAA